VTDHDPLTSLKDLKDVGGRLTRWMLYLQQFDFSFKHRPGKHHANADTMSRIPPAQQPILPVLYQVTNHDAIKSAQQSDPSLSAIIQALTHGKPIPTNVAPGLRHTFLRDGFLCRTYRDSSSSAGHVQIVVPHSFQHSILQQLHNQSGHLGVHKTLEKVKERYYWPGYESDISTWIRECQQCQQRKPPPQTQHAPLGTITSDYPFEKLSWDIMGPLPLSSAGNRYIVVITDLFSKWVEAFPIKSTDTETLATLLIDEVVCRFGVPHYIHSDQGANLISNLMATVCERLGIKQTHTSGYHPQGNGQVERFNRTLESMLSMVVNDHQTDWDVHLPKVLFAYRTAIHDATGFSPFHVTFGRSPTLPIDAMTGTLPQPNAKKLPAFLDTLHRSLTTAYQIVRRQIQLSHHHNKQRYDKEKPYIPFTVGDQVWLYVPAVRPGRTKKFTSQWSGPYTVIDRITTSNYRIRLIGSTKEMVVHHNRLKLCYGTPQVVTAPPGMLLADRPSYSDVVRRSVSTPVGGYTSSSTDPPPALAHDTTPTTRPSRHCGPPTRFNDYVRSD